jgi:Tfp pilus assembly protein PilF
MHLRLRVSSLVLALGLIALSSAHAQQAATAPAPAATPALTTPADAAKQLITSAVQRMNANDIDGALNDLTQAIKTNPNSTGAYVLRASLYCQKKQWALAEADFQAASKIAPGNVVLKFNLIEVKFMQKEYNEARTGFESLQKDPATLQGDPEMVDFAAYKVFLCDLFGGHEDQAKKELDVFNEAMGNPSYYFSNAAWDLVHKNLDDARGWLLSASRIYPPEKNQYYAQSLRDLGYLPIPAPGDQVKPVPAATHP